MIDYSDPATANQRLSHAEREDAVAALARFGAEGRLTDAEVQQRSETARTAVTRGDLAGVFADLPAAEHASTPQQAPPVAQPGAGIGGYDYGDGSRRGPARSMRYAVVSLAPFVALALFFIFGNVWGFEYAWLWFLLIPIAGIVMYGTGGWGDHDRDRYHH